MHHSTVAEGENPNTEISKTWGAGLGGQVDYRYLVFSCYSDYPGASKNATNVPV